MASSLDSLSSPIPRMALPLAWLTAWTSWAGFGPGTRTSRGVVCTMWARPPTPATACLSSSSPPGWSVKESWRTWDHLQMRCNHQVLFFSLIVLPTPAFDRGVKAPPGARNEEGRELLPRRRLETFAAEIEPITIDWHPGAAPFSTVVGFPECKRGGTLQFILESPKSRQIS